MNCLWDKFLQALSTWQRKSAWSILITSLVIAALSVPLIQQLGLNSSWTALLPKEKASVQDLEKVKDRVGGLSSLTIAIQSGDLDAMQRFAKKLVPRLESIDNPTIRSIDWTVAPYEKFVRENKHLYANLDDLTAVRDSLKQKYQKETGKLNPFFIDLEEEEGDPLEEAAARLEAKAKESKAKLAKFPGGFYVHADRDLLFMFVRTDLQGGDTKGSDRLIQDVEREVNALQPSTYAPDLRVDYAGDIIMAQEEQKAIVNELVIATSITIFGVLLAIYIFFRRLRALAMLGISVMVPVAVTFALAELAVDYLNTSTAFLGSIVIGNGINPSIIWLARYYEERRRGRNIRTAILATHRGATLATLTASLAAGVAYGSLILTDFRGFRDFGIIGGIGMALCWLSATILLPAVAAIFEKVPGFHKVKHPPTRNAYGMGFFKIIDRAPGTVLVGSIMLTAVSAIFVTRALAADPMEYDFRNLKSVRKESTTAQKIQHRYGETVSSQKQGNGIAMLVPSIEDTRYVQKELERRRDQDNAPYGNVRSIYNLLPKDQEKKLPLLAEIRSLMLKLRPHATAKEQARIDKNIPPAKVSLVKLADMPDMVARPFTEKDGSRGRVLVIEEKKNDPNMSIWDGRYLMSWSAALRDMRLKDGTRPPLAGRAPVFADMVEVIISDGPKAIMLSFFATFLLVAVAFRRVREQLLTMSALLFGILWMAGTMALCGMKLNFLNFVAFPITFGNGVDYGVNIMRRFSMDSIKGEESAIRTAVEETGGAVVLCSLTTIIGYSSLYASANLALNSFGAAMAISEITCVASAIVAVPAYVIWSSRRRARATSQAPIGSR